MVTSKPKRMSLYSGVSHFMKTLLIMLKEIVNCANGIPHDEVPCGISENCANRAAIYKIQSKQ